MSAQINPLMEALVKLEATADECRQTLQKEKEKRELVTRSLQETEAELSNVLSNEDNLIQQQIDVELSKPMEIGQQFQERLAKRILDIQFKRNERTYMVDDLQYTITNMRQQYHQMERQLQKSQALVHDYGNQLNQKQQEYLQLQSIQVQKNKEYRELQEEVDEMNEMLQKLKDVQFTLNKVIGREDLNKTTTTNEEVFQNSFMNSTGHGQQKLIVKNGDQQEDFWYRDPQSPLKLPRIK